MMVDRPVTRDSQNALLRQAVGILRTRYGLAKGCADVPSTTAAAVVLALETAADGADGSDREEAIALAHRVVDNDQPELSPLWPRTSSDAGGR